MILKSKIKYQLLAYATMNKTNKINWEETENIGLKDDR